MAPSNYFHKPELALRRAIELQGIHQTDAALELLHDVLSSRRQRTWSLIYEQIMITYIDLCCLPVLSTSSSSSGNSQYMNKNRSREVKDGLHQYRNLCQTNAPGSLEKVILYLLNKAETACQQAKAYADGGTDPTSSMTHPTITTPGPEATTDPAAEENDEADASNTPPPPPSSTNDELGGGGDEEEDGAMDGFSASPQAILLSMISIDPMVSNKPSATAAAASTSTSTSQILLPSLKFLWEIYRAILDILRSNSKLEHVYHITAQSALKFCQTYHRKMEFRHLCDMLRTHLGNLRHTITTSNALDTNEDGTKSNNKVRGWEGWTAESIELYLQTRFVQLETASALHRYTEGFRTVEDIYNILQISQARRKINPDIPPPKAKLMAAYYEKLTTLFWVSENHLFHGFAWYKYYSLCREYNRSMNEDMKRMQASAVLLAALCIPPTPNNSSKGIVHRQQQHGIRTTAEDDIVKQKMARMATLLGFHTRNPTRESLLLEIQSKNILSQVPKYLQDLYVIFEETLDPLSMVDRAKPLLEQLKQEIGATTSTETENDDVSDTTLGRYVEPLTHVLLLKVLVNLSVAYQTVSIQKLQKLTAGLGMPFEQVEKSIVQFTQTKTLSVRIDHRSGCLRFGDADLESDMMRSQLTVLAKQLYYVNQEVLFPPTDNTNQLEERKVQYNAIRSNLHAEHMANLERKLFIDKKKEEGEKLAQDKVKEQLRIKMEEEALRRAEEEKRMERELKQREQEKHKRIQLELENQEKKRFLLAMGKKTDEITEEEMAKIDTEALQKEHQAKINKEKEEAERKTKEIAKKLDYLVRAIRIEELPLVKKKYEEKIRLDRERYEQETIEKSRKAKEQWELDVKDKAILEEHSVFAYFAQFEEAIMKDRKAKHAIICKEVEAEAEIAAEKAKIRRARRRRDEERNRIAAEEAKIKEEEERKKAEEEAKKKEEARREKEAKEEEARQAERRRMDEESRRRAESTATSATRSAPPPLSTSRFGGAGGASTGTSEGGSSSGKYIPPSRRNNPSGSSSGPGVGSRSYGDSAGSRSGGDDRSRAYPGGGRYEGRSQQGGTGTSRFDIRPSSSQQSGGSNDRYGSDRRSGGGGNSGGAWRK